MHSSLEYNIQNYEKLLIFIEVLASSRFNRGRTRRQWWGLGSVGDTETVATAGSRQRVHVGRTVLHVTLRLMRRLPEKIPDGPTPGSDVRLVSLKWTTVVGDDCRSSSFSVLLSTLAVCRSCHCSRLSPSWFVDVSFQIQLRSRSRVAPSRPTSVVSTVIGNYSETMPAFTRVATWSPPTEVTGGRRHWLDNLTTWPEVRLIDNVRCWYSRGHRSTSFMHERATTRRLHGLQALRIFRNLQIALSRLLWVVGLRMTEIRLWVRHGADIGRHGNRTWEASYSSVLRTNVNGDDDGSKDGRRYSEPAVSAAATDMTSTRRPAWWRLNRSVYLPSRCLRSI